jgi:DNA adenine methylase
VTLKTGYALSLPFDQGVHECAIPANETQIAEDTSSDPFLKWAGGKRWLVSAWRCAFEVPHTRYHEPFLGGAAAFFSKPVVPSYLSDLNARLIETYQVVRDSPQDLAARLRVHHRKHSKDYYYSIRDVAPRSAIARAAQFIYLNRTCWNGLYRLNLRGEFNVPIGTKTAVFEDENEFASVARRLAGSQLIATDFETAIDRATDGDLVFADPPYTAKHNQNGFIKYNEKLFSWADQVRLRDALVAASRRGAFVLATNAAHSSIRELYRGQFDIQRVSRQSVLAGKSSARGETEEFLISNYLW